MGSDTGSCARTPCAVSLSPSRRRSWRSSEPPPRPWTTPASEREAMLRDLAAKLQAMLRAESKARVEFDLEMQVQAKGLAMRPGPMERLDRGLLSLLHQTIATCWKEEFCCFAQSTRRWNRQQIRPLGLLYGNRVQLGGVNRVGRGEPRLWRPAEHERSPDYRPSVRAEPGVRFAAVRREFVRHVPGKIGQNGAALRCRGGAGCRRRSASIPTQSIEENEDGSLTCASRWAASTRCAGTCSREGRA